MMTGTKTKPYPLAPDLWTFRGEAAYSGRVDHRQLLQIRHPWVESTEGGFGEWSARVALPAELAESERVYLSFYTSDDYSGERLDQPGWIGAQAFSGHRFKQLLINGEVVWEEDVAEQELLPSSLGGYGGYTADDPSPSYSEAYRVLDITSYARAEMQITVRVFDKVASSVQLAGDQFYRFSWGTADPQQARNWFQTEAFFGDLVVSTLPDAHRQEPRKIEPCSPSSASFTAEPEVFVLELVSPGDLPVEGYPVRCGVPIPHGLVKPATPFALVDPTGESVPVAITATSYWSDGSVRWMLCEFVGRRGGTWRLVPGKPAASPFDPVTVLSEEGSVSLSTGSVAIRIGKAEGEGLFEELVQKGTQRVGPGRLSIKLNRVGWLEAFKGLRREVVVEKANPICAVVRASGDLISDAGTRFGPWTARIEVWSGLPYIFIDWGIVNESDQSMAMLLDWSARLFVPDSLGTLLDFGNFQPVPLEEHRKDLWYRASPAPMHVENERALPLNENTFYTCRQEGPDQARIFSVHFWVGVAEKAPGYVCMRKDGRSLVAAMRWFAEEFPKGIQVVPGELRLATLPESEGSLAWLHDAPFVRLGRGEGKRQRFALWLSEGDVASEEVERFAACLHDPPCLYDRTWFLKSHAMETAPPERSDDMHRWEEAIGPVFSASGLDVPRLGHREHWDTVWMNNYRSRAHAGLIRFFETGDPRWFRYFDAVCRHVRDVDIIHYCPERPEWVGSIHEYSADHTSGPPMGNIGLNSDDLLEHYLMTGDPDSLSAARGLAEFILTCNPWGRSARAVGWPLAQVVRWYDQTGDERFLIKAQELVKAALAFTEPRRGVFDELHGNFNYHGSVPFMTAYLAYGLIRYHQLTRDEETLRLLCKLGDGVLAECQTTPGRFRYSPYPECNLIGLAASTCGWSVNLGGLFGYLYLQTGDEVYRRGMQDCFEAVLEHPEEASLDMVELQGWLLRGVVGGP